MIALWTVVETIWATRECFICNAVGRCEHRELELTIAEARDMITSGDRATRKPIDIAATVSRAERTAVSA